MKFVPAPHQFRTGDVLQADDINRNFDHFRELVDETIDNGLVRTTVSLSAVNFAFDDPTEFRTLRWVAPTACTVEQFRITVVFSSASAGTGTPTMIVDGYVNATTIPGLTTRVASLTYTDSGASTNSYQELTRFSLDAGDDLSFLFGQLTGNDEWVLTAAFVDLNLVQSRWNADGSDDSVPFEPAVINGGDNRSAAIVGIAANALGVSVDALVSWKTIEHLPLHGTGLSNIVYVPESSGERRLTGVYAFAQTDTAGTGGTVNLVVRNDAGTTLQTLAITIANGATWGYSSTAISPVINLGGGDFTDTSGDVNVYISTTTVGGATLVRGGATLVFRKS